MTATLPINTGISHWSNSRIGDRRITHRNNSEGYQLVTVTAMRIIATRTARAGTSTLGKSSTGCLSVRSHCDSARTCCYCASHAAKESGAVLLEKTRFDHAPRYWITLRAPTAGSAWSSHRGSGGAHLGRWPPRESMARRHEAGWRWSMVGGRKGREGSSGGDGDLRENPLI